ncbi:MAG TPA: hypothetical protein VHX39_20775, partial [Acetobacteraceae bacterium]|nr:hypothetical protein [Acetobacteraceae bacterium]
MLGFGYHAPLTIPAALLGILRLVLELAEHPRRFAGLFPLLSSCMHLSPMILRSRWLRAMPNKKSTRWASHQL